MNRNKIHVRTLDHKRAEVTLHDGTPIPGVHSVTLRMNVHQLHAVEVHARLVDADVVAEGEILVTTLPSGRRFHLVPLDPPAAPPLPDPDDDDLPKPGKIWDVGPSVPQAEPPPPPAVKLTRDALTRDRVRASLDGFSCPACPAPKSPGDHVCAACWHRLPQANQHALTTHHVGHGYEDALFDALQFLGVGTLHTAAEATS